MDVSAPIRVARGILLAAGLSLSLPACAADGVLPLHTIKLPPGFAIELYARIDEARSLSAAPALNAVFVGTRDDAIFAVIDANHDAKADRVVKVIDGLSNANSIAWHAGVLYVAERHRLLAYPAPDIKTLVKSKPRVVFSGIPDTRHHGKRYTAVGPDGMVYISSGAPCNICRVDGLAGTLLRIDPKTGQGGVFAYGVRNTVGIDFQPTTGEVYFTDNGGDGMGDDSPPDELNHAPRAGLHFGYPWYGGGSDRTPQFRGEAPPNPVTFPVVRFGAHVAALGLHFYRGKLLPEAYRRDAFVAQHGSWNRSVPDGYRVARVRFDSRGKATGWEPFAEGWLRPDGNLWGRPVDVEELPDGSLLVSDDHAGAVYRIRYSGK